MWGIAYQNNRTCIHLSSILCPWQVGFTPMCRSLPPEVVMAFLNDLFSRLDELTAIYGVYKVETIGGELHT